MKTKPLFTLLAGVLLLSLPARGETLSALGRVLPKSGVIDVAGTAGATVEAINVREGDWVEPGQSLARLSSTARAVERLARTEADLTAIRTSTGGDVEVARTRVVNAEAEAKIADERFTRINSARDSEFVSPDQIEERTLNRQNTQLKLLQARQSFEAAKREAAKALHVAEADVTAARTELAAAEVRAPLKARVLKTFARAGAVAGRSELFKLGDTSEMIVVAEIYETDVLKVRPGQTATISSAALPAKMKGTVASVSSLVFRNALETLDPNQNAQSRVVEVTVKMNEAQPLDRLVLLQVDVTIDL